MYKTTFSLRSSLYVFRGLHLRWMTWFWLFFFYFILLTCLTIVQEIRMKCFRENTDKKRALRGYELRHVLAFNEQREKNKVNFLNTVFCFLFSFYFWTDVNLNRQLLAESNTIAYAIFFCFKRFIILFSTKKLVIWITNILNIIKKKRKILLEQNKNLKLN